MVASLKAGISSWLADHKNKPKGKIQQPLDVTLLRQERSLQASTDKERARSELEEDFNDFMTALSMYYAHGKRTQWAREFGLEGLLVKFIQPGSVFDQFSGFRNMSKDQISTACCDFFLEVVALLHDEHNKMSESKPAVGNENGVAAVEGGKFQSVPNAVYAKIDEFYRGPEARIGIPNPVSLPAMKAEHCLRSTANKSFVAPNYGLCTTSEIEWYWVNNPGLGLAFFNKVIQILLFKNTEKDGDIRPFLFRGEVDLEVSETVFQVKMRISKPEESKQNNPAEEKERRDEEVQLWQEDVLERLTLVFAPESRFFHENVSFFKEKTVPNCLREIRPLKMHTWIMISACECRWHWHLYKSHWKQAGAYFWMP
jgi:hypothetical protein